MNPLPLPQSTNQQVALALPFVQISAADLPIVGGKGANLGELTRAGFAVPAGFCVTTAAFQLFLANYEDLDQLYQELDTIPAGNLEMTRQIGQQVRERLQLVAIPAEVAAAIVEAWQTLGNDDAYAVRSSATAEDLPDASFAGQQDTYLNVRGEQALLEAVRRCWISLYTDRAIVYRQQNNFNHRDVLLSVVVQRMVRPEVSGIMFTADPVSGHRGIVSIDASFGLGEALVSGLVSADLYQVDTARNRLDKRQIADKQMAIRPLPDGGVEHVALSAEERATAVLTDAQALELAKLGKQIEAHYGKPQDIEWALENGRLYVLQARPITSLYPLPQPQPHDDALHAYISFSHAQVMTDPMPNLSLSIWRTVFPFGRPHGATENPAVCVAGGRIFLDVSLALRHPVMKRLLPGIVTSMLDSLMGQAMRKVIARDDFQRRGDRLSTLTLAGRMLPAIRMIGTRLVWAAPEGMAGKVLREMRPYLDNVEQRLATAPTEGARLREASLILQTAFSDLVWRLVPYAATGLIASRLLERVATSFASHDDITAVMRGLRGNVTTDMDLAVGDLADLVRQTPALAQHLAQPQVDATELLGTADTVAGSDVFIKAWRQFLAQYGMRGPSEIDISRSRWHEDPTSLLNMILGNIQLSEAGAHRTHFARMEREGLAAAARLVEQAKKGRLGWLRGRIVKRLTRVTRELLPMREHHKFVIVQMLGLVKKAVVETAELLAAQQRIDRIDDVWFLSLSELIAAVDDPAQDVRTRIHSRRTEFARFQTMTPPRVITSEGEIIIAEYAAVDAPENALIGSPVSTGIVEGIARVVLDPQTEIVRAGEILVAPFTDPGWTPLFINAAGLVTEVGGLMTHGSLVAREYGIPAVVGVKDATKRIKTGQRIRVHGDGGYIELLDKVDTEPEMAVLTPVLSMI